MKIEYGLFVLILFCSGIIACESKIEKVYYPNGQIKFVGRVSNELPEGLCSTFYDNGKLMQISNWNQGKMNGSRKYYYNNGVLKEKSHWKNDSLDGWATYYAPNGKVEMIGKYQNGEGVGWFRYFDSQGKLISLVEFINSQGSTVMNQNMEFDQKGEIINEKSYYLKFYPKNRVLFQGRENQIKVHLEGSIYKRNVRIILNECYSSSSQTGDIIEGRKLWTTIYINPKKKGIYHFCGKVQEYTDTVPTVNGFQYKSRDIFFSRKYIVK